MGQVMKIGLAVTKRFQKVSIQILKVRFYLYVAFMFNIKTHCCPVYFL